MYAEATIRRSNRKTTPWPCPCRRWITKAEHNGLSTVDADDSDWKIGAGASVGHSDGEPTRKSFPDWPREGEMVVVSDRSGLKAGQQRAAQPIDGGCNTRPRRTAVERRRQPMPRFSIRNPYFIVVICLVLLVIGVTASQACRWICFRPSICRKWWWRRSIPECRRRISRPTSPLRWSASSRWPAASTTSNRDSLLGVSIIKVFFQPGTNADADVTQLSNLALADLKRLPPGTLPPVVLKSDASSLPVCSGRGQRRGADRDAASRLRAVRRSAIRSRS